MGARIRVLAIGLLAVWARPAPECLAAAHQPWARRPGVILYHLKPGSSPEERTALGRVFGSYRLAAAPSQAAKSYQALAFPQSVGDEETMAETLKASGAVDFAEPDYLMPAAAAIPDDPQYPSQWFHQTIHSPAAWAYTTGSASILVAVCDTGVDSTHPDLLANVQLPGFNVVSRNTDTSALTPHGTEVAGVLGAVGNNAIGVTGVNWGVKILPVRITNNLDESAWCSSMASGIEWAADHGAKIINLSYETMGCPGTIETASAYAKTLGALVFVAAGNGAQDLSAIYPAQRSFILVGATDSADQQVIFSNYGAPVSLGAPGRSIVTTRPGGGYGTVNGTSFSAPLAAGVAALILALNPAWTPDTVRDILFATAHPIALNLLGYGRIDAGAALAAAQGCRSGNCPSPVPLGNPPPLFQPPATVTASNAPAVRAYPNPWRSDKHTAPMVLDHLAAGSDIRIFTISGQLVRRLAADALGAASWDLSNSSGERVASGIYLFLAKDAMSHDARGKLAVIR